MELSQTIVAPRSLPTRGRPANEFPEFLGHMLKVM